MKRGKHLFSRSVAMILALSMLLPLCNVGVVAAPSNPTGTSVTEGQIIAENYGDILTNEEKALLNSGVLAPTKVTYTVPSNEKSELVSVDVDTMIATVSPSYQDDQGNTWTAAGQITVTDDRHVSETFALENGKSDFSAYTGNHQSYSVAVDYTLTRSVDEKTQLMAMNAPYYLAQGLAGLDALAGTDVRSGLTTLSQQKHQLEVLAGSTQVGQALITFDCKQNAQNLLDEYKANGNRLYLETDLDGYSAPYTQFLFTSGETVLDHALSAYNNIYAIATNLRQVYKSMSSLSDDRFAEFFGMQREEYLLAMNTVEGIAADLGSAMNTLAGGLGFDIDLDVDKQIWVAAAKEYGVAGVKSILASDVNYDALDALVKACAYSTVTLDSETGGPYGKAALVGTELTVKTTNVSYNLNRHQVTVQVKAAVIDAASIDSAATTALHTYETTVLVSDGSSYAEVLEVIANSGIEETALAGWDTYYQVNSDNYTRTVSGMAEGDTLRSDAALEIAYAPKELEIVYASGYEEADKGPDKVPYGYQMRLPVHEDAKKAYDYVVNGESLEQNSLIRIVGNTTISRTEGKAWETHNVGGIVAENYVPQDLKILTSPAVNTGTIRLRTPTDGSTLVAITGEGDSYHVTAKTYKADTGTLVWVPSEVLMLDAAGEELQRVAMAQSGSDFIADIGLCASIHVRYVLVLPMGYTDAISKDNLTTLANLAATLATQAELQLAAMEQIEDQRSNLAEVNTKLNLINSTIRGDETVSQQTKDAWKQIMENGRNGEDLALYVHLLAYQKLAQADRLVYYYQNYTALKANVDLLTESFAILKDDPALEKLLADAGYGDYYAKFPAIYERLIEVRTNMVQPDAHIRATATSTQLKTLADLILAYTDTSNKTVDADPVLTTLLALDMPGKASLSVQVQVKSSAGEVEDTYTAVMTFDFNNDADGDGTPDRVVLTEEQISRINAQISALLANVDVAHYEQVSANVPVAGDEMLKSMDVTVVYAPKSYTLNYAENGESAGSTTFFFDDPVVTLPTADSGYRYDYTIDGETVTGGTKYTFTTEQLDRLFVDGSCTVSRTTVDVQRESLLTLVDQLNNAILDAGLTYHEDGKDWGIVTFLLTEDAEGNKTLVMRVSPQAQMDIKAGLKEVAQVIANTDRYIGVEGSTMWDGDKLYLQSVVDAVLNSGVGLQTIQQVVDENGDIIELELDGTVINVDGSVLHNPDVYGGSVFNCNLQFGESASATQDIKLHVTLEDFDKRASSLKNVRDLSTKLLKYADVALDEGAVQLTLKNDRAYQAYLTVALAAGYANPDDLTTLDTEAYLEFLFGYASALVSDPTITLETYENTVKELGKNASFSKYSKYYNYARKLANNLISNSEKLSSDGKTWNLRYNGVGALLNNINIPESIQGMVAEKENGVTYAVKFNLPETTYQAVILDPNAAGLGKLRYVTDLESYLANVHDNSYVLLLSDIPGSLTADKKIILDLNGKTIAGDLTGNSQIVVVDSTLDTANCGTIQGTISGSVKITAGNYDTDVSAFLPKNYVQTNGAVSNGLYTMAVQDGTLQVILDAKSINLAGFPSAKTVAGELAIDLALNYYTAAALRVNGSELYSIQLNDLVGMVGDGISAQDVNAVLDCLNLDGINTVANQMLADLTNFGSLASAIESGSALATYDYETDPWDLELDVVDNYLTGNIMPDSSRPQTSKLEILLGGSAADQQAVQKLCQALADVTTIDQLEVTAESIHYGNKTLFVQGSAVGDVTFDLSKDPNYAIALGVILANGTSGDSRTALINGINTVYDEGNITALKEAFDALTTSEIISAVSLYNRSTDFDAMVAGLGLTDKVTAAVSELNDTYRSLLVILGAGLRRAPISGGSKTMSALETETGTYTLTGSRTMDRTVNFRGYAVDLTAVVETSTLTVKLFPEDPIVFGKIVVTNGDEELYKGNSVEDAFAAATSGSTITVLSEVVQKENVTVSGEVTIIGGGLIDQNGNSIILNDTNARITSDAELDVTTERSDCYVRMTEVDGHYVYTLELYPVVVTDANGNVVYAGDDLAAGFAAAKDGYTITVNSPVALEKNITIPENTNIILSGASQIDMGDKTITLSKGSSLKSDAEFQVDTQIKSASKYSKVTQTGSAGSYLYSLQALDPNFDGRTPAVNVGSVILGAKVDTENKLIYLDVPYTGITLEQFNTLVSFPANNASKVEAVLTGTNSYQGRSNVINGATVTVKATNPDSQVTATVVYTVIVMGDTNCNGRIEAGDATRMEAHYQHIHTLTGVALLAADMNQNGRVDAGDGVVNANKYQNRDLTSYVSMFK